MSRTNLDLGLRDLQTQITTLARDVEETLTVTLAALETGEHHLLPQIVEHSQRIEAMRAVAERQALHLLILQQPLGGRDLRYLTAAFYISDSLARSGDCVVQIARALLQAASLYHQTVGPALYSVEGNAVDSQGLLTDVFILRGLLYLGREIQHILARTTEALAQKDVLIARTIEAEHDLVELHYTPISQGILEIQAEMSVLPASQIDASFLQRITSLLWMAHKLAEVATCVTHVCKRIVFIVEG